MAKRAPKGPETLYDKVKKFDEDLAVGVNAMSSDDLKSKLVGLSRDDSAIEDARELDSDLKSIQEELTTAKQTYSVPLKQNKLRRKLILDTLKGRGAL
jgi:hypothetical protein